MWMAPIGILYGFNHNLFPALQVKLRMRTASRCNSGLAPPKDSHHMAIEITSLSDFSSYSMTLLSGFLAVLSVNIVIAVYICMAMKEPSDKHEPDPAFLAEAKASLRHPIPNEAEDSSQALEKQE
ncbi:hypothetical protein F0562_019572 [Nyssa sinensis]|uniref:Vacuolar ATPase assembly integral membrane protein VMA21 homolog n=1 Tax=Nyssa sinensis TaxID=561372 RepID=A0A5J5BPZ8_9ASTE|nr:hypothetical protein F0562_019572 [Nyssa sinensis]